MIEGLERATRVLDLFSKDVPEWSVSDVSRELMMPKTTIWEWVRAMTELGLLRRTGRSSYRLGWRAFQLGQRARMTSEIAGRAREAMASLVERYGVTAQLAVRHGRDIVYLEKAAPRVGMRINATRVGERLPAHCTAEGKVLLAYRPKKEIRKLFNGIVMEQLTEHSITTPAALESELAAVRERGFASDIEEAVEGMCCVAAPVTNRHGDIAWALSMSFLEYRLGEHQTYIDAVTDAARQLSEAP